MRKSSDTSVLRNLSVETICGDLLDKNSLGPALDGIELVYHLAGEVYSRRIDDYYRGNVLGTQNLLEAFKRETGPKRVIFLSSIAVYKPVIAGNLLTEESECKPLTVYGRTKLAAEELIKGCSIPWVIVRAPIVYGPYQPPVVNRFFLDAFNKMKIYTIGKENNPRSLCFVDNLVNGLMLLPNRPDTSGKIYILSDNSPYTLDEIVPAISLLTGQKVEIVHLPNVLGNVSWGINKVVGKLFNLYFIELYALKTMQLHWECDISKAKNEIGYNPNSTLEMGVSTTLNWIRKNNAGWQR